jgi:hypothetical protein
MSETNNNGYSLVFGPFPTAAYSGNTFLVFYKKLQQTMVNDTDVQNTIPISFQNVITAFAEAKIFQLSNPERVSGQLQYSQSLLNNLKRWDWAQPSKVRVFRDANFDSGFNSAYDNSVYFRLGSMNH